MKRGLSGKEAYRRAYTQAGICLGLWFTVRTLVFPLNEIGNHSLISRREGTWSETSQRSFLLLCWDCLVAMRGVNLLNLCERYHECAAVSASPSPAWTYKGVHFPAPLQSGGATGLVLDEETWAADTCVTAMLRLQDSPVSLFLYFSASNIVNGTVAGSLDLSDYKKLPPDPLISPA